MGRMCEESFDATPKSLTLRDDHIEYGNILIMKSAITSLSISEGRTGREELLINYSNDKTLTITKVDVSSVTAKFFDIPGPAKIKLAAGKTAYITKPSYALLSFEFPKDEEKYVIECNDYGSTQVGVWHGYTTPRAAKCSSHIHDFNAACLYQIFLTWLAFDPTQVSK